MKDNLSIIISMIIFVILIVIFPLYNYFERQDDMSYNLVNKATTNFVDEVTEAGYLDQEMYNRFVDELSSTGNVYDIELEAHKKIRTTNDGGNTYDEQYLIDYNNQIFSGDNIASNLNEKTIKDNAYYLNEGDQFYVKLKNSNTTMAGAIFNTIVPASSKDRIVVNYGGIIKNEAWSKVDATYNAFINFDKAPQIYVGGSAIQNGQTTQILKGCAIKIEGVLNGVNDFNYVVENPSGNSEYSDHSTTGINHTFGNEGTYKVTVKSNSVYAKESSIYIEVKKSLSVNNYTQLIEEKTGSKKYMLETDTFNMPYNKDINFEINIKLSYSSSQSWRLSRDTFGIYVKYIDENGQSKEKPIKGWTLDGISNKVITEIPSDTNYVPYSFNSFNKIEKNENKYYDGNFRFKETLDLNSIKSMIGNNSKIIGYYISYSQRPDLTNGIIYYFKEGNNKRIAIMDYTISVN